MPDEFVSEVEGPCPCGGHWYAGRTKIEQRQAVMHTKPTCKDYDKLGIDEYLKWIREGIQGVRTN